MSESDLHLKIRNYLMAKFSQNWNASIIAIESVDEPLRFDEPVILAVVSYKSLEKHAAETLAETDPEDLEQMRKVIAWGKEAVFIFDSAGKELEKHFRGIDYLPDYRELKI